MTYSIPEMNMEALEKKLARISKKAAKYGCDFRFEKTGEHFETRELDEYDENGKHKTEEIRYIDIEVEGKAEVNGWQFAASLDYTPKGNIISGVAGLEIPERYYSCTPWCEHCKTQRDRKSSYIVYHAESGEYKQVGKGCLRDYTGGLSAEAVAQYESWIKECEEASEFSGRGGWGIRYFKTDEFMAAVAETIRIYGYVKRNTPGTIDTATLAEELFKVECGMSLGVFADQLRAQYWKAVDRGWKMNRPESVELAKRVREWIAGSEKNDNYFHNLKVACAIDHIAGNCIGLVASAFPAYDRELEYQAEKLRRERRAAEEGAASNYVGKVGDRVSFTASYSKCVTGWETMYGYTYIYKFADEKGNVYTWKTGKELDCDDTVYAITGTVKEHKEFRGVKQTELTRCKVTEIREVKKVEAPAEDPFAVFCKAYDELEALA